MINPKHKKISIRRQCELLGLVRSSLYYEPKRASKQSKNTSGALIRPVWETKENLLVMDRLDQLYMKHPFLGSP